jgi:hypothetical protein
MRPEGCPECGSAAESGGVVATGARLFWSAGRRGARAMGLGGETLARVRPYWRTAEIEARRCPGCRLIWFTY